jgi:hypothetical protein
MNKRQMVLTAAMSSFFTLTIIASIMLFLSQAMAAPPPETEETALFQTTVDTFQYVSISALAFVPVRQNVTYTKDVQRQILSLTGQIANVNIFIAPLTLPDRSDLLGMTVFGEDFDNHGEVRLRLKRCDHGQVRCVNLAETTSTTDYAAGQFETTRISIPNEIVDNRFYSYFLELELTSLANSGLRSVRLEVVTRSPTSSDEEQWALAGGIRSFLLPNSDLTQARICTDDLSHLNNPTHYPFIVVDEGVIPLSSGTCVTVWGHDIEVRRRANTGPSSGTYQFLR